MRCVICGKGGQGVVTISAVMGNLAVSLGRRAISSETHGMAMRGGSVYASLKIGDYFSASVAEGEAELLLSTDAGEVERNLRFLSGDGVVITDGFYPSGNFETICINAKKTALQKFGSAVHAGAILLGAAIARFPEVFPPEKSADILKQDKKINCQALFFGLGKNLWGN